VSSDYLIAFVYWLFADVFTHLRADALLSLTVFVAGITIKIFNSVAISDILFLTAGDK